MFGREVVLRCEIGNAFCKRTKVEYIFQDEKPGGFILGVASKVLRVAQ